MPLVSSRPSSSHLTSSLSFRESYNASDESAAADPSARPSHSSNILMRKIGCRAHLSAIVILWGAVMLGMGFVKTWEQLAVCRVLLGLLES